MLSKRAARHQPLERTVAAAGVPGEEQNLTPSIGFFIGAGFAEWLSQRTGKPLDQLRISIGRDSRLSGPLLASSMAAGIASRGTRVAQFGLATTPAMFMSCIIEGFQYDGAIIITASHLPFNRNGFKFFTGDGGLEKGDIADLLARAAKSSAAVRVHPAARHTDDAHLVATALQIQPDMLEQVDFMPVYADHLRKIIKLGVSRKENFEKPLEGFKIAVDPGNGGGGFFATDVLAPLGADVSGSQFLDPDGWFPNHVPNPEDKTAMAAGVDAVLRSRSDLGVVLDTDVDRSAVVSRDGQAIAQNRYIALMSVITLRKYPGTTIVTDSVTSNGLTAFIESLGGKHFRYRRGYKNVIGKGMELNKSGTDAALMMETSGHGAVKENYFLDDGAYSAVQIIIEVVRRKLAGEADIMEQLLKELKEPVESQEFRLKITVKPALHQFCGERASVPVQVKDFKPVGDQVAVDEGHGEKGWLLLRSSLHDPLLVLNVESDLPGGARKTVLHLRKFFAANGDFPLDTSRLQEVVAAHR
eukprot:jgi/Astpho2/8353/Aster-01419